MPEKFLISKALDLTPTAVAKSTSSTLKGLLVLAGIAGLGWAIYAGIIRPVTKPNPTMRQEAEQIENYTYNYSQPKTVVFLGLDLWDWKLGLYKDKTEIRQERVTQNQVK